MAKKRRRVRPPTPPIRNIMYDLDRPLPPGAENAGPVGGYSYGDKGEIHVLKGTDKFTLAHETGHLLDAQVLSDGDRQFFQRLLHSPTGPWNQGTGAAGGYHSPSEQFADYYAAAATGYDPRPKRKGKAISGGSTDSYTPIGPKRLKRLTQALERLQRRNNLQDYRG